MPHHFALSVQDIQGDGGDVAFQEVIDHSAERKCSAPWVRLWQRRAGEAGRMNAVRRRGFKQQDIGLRRPLIEPAERRNIVQDPEGSAVGWQSPDHLREHRCHDGCHRQVQLKRLPDGRHHRKTRRCPIRSCVQQPCFFRIFTHDVHKTSIGDSGRDRRPGFSGVARAIDVGFVIVSR